MDLLGSVFWLLVTLGVLVTFHELGHFWVARLFGVKVLRFCVGFGKPIWSRLDKQGTEISVAPIPLGGYVKMLDSRDCDVSAANPAEVYNNKPIYQRFLILFAGPAFNFILALVLYWAMFVVGKDEIRPTLGKPQQLAATAGFERGEQLLKIDGEKIQTWTDVLLAVMTAGIDRRDVAVEVKNSGGSELLRTLPLSKIPDSISEEGLFKAVGFSQWQAPWPALMAELPADMPAAKAGLQAGDLIVGINNQPIDSWYDLLQAVGGIKSGKVTIDFERNGERQQVVVPQLVPSKDDPQRMVLGVTPQQRDAKDVAFAKSMVYRQSYGPIEAIPQAFYQAAKITDKTLEMLWKLIAGKASVKNLSGPITIAKVANQSAQRGVSWYLSFLALVSLSLGILNLLPIPMLDGGQILFLLFEKIKGAPLSERFEMNAQMVGMFLLFSLMSVAFYNDILRSVS